MPSKLRRFGIRRLTEIAPLRYCLLSQGHEEAAEMKLAPRNTLFWTEPWFLTLAVIAGQLYGVWWVSFGAPEPSYYPTRTVMASNSPDGFNLTITAPALPGTASLN